MKSKLFVTKLGIGTKTNFFHYLNKILSFTCCQRKIWRRDFVISHLCTVNLAPAQSHIWHVLCKICFTIILCWLHLRLIWHTMCQKNGEAYLTHVKKNMLHMWLIVLHLRQLCRIVCHIWLCAGTDLQCGVLNTVLYSILLNLVPEGENLFQKVVNSNVGYYIIIHY
jgi:hypothetical protein